MARPTDALPPEEGWICKGEPDGRPDHDPIQVHPLRRCPSCGEPPAAAPAPEGVPEDHRVCSHGIYHHGCPSCDRQDPEDR